MISTLLKSVQLIGLALLAQLSAGDAAAQVPTGHVLCARYVEANDMAMQVATASDTAPALTKPPLFETQIEDGKRIVERLDTDQFGVTAALWYYVPEGGNWVLVIASDLVVELGFAKSSARLQGSLDRLGQNIKIDDIQISLIEPNHELLRSLRRGGIGLGPGLSTFRIRNSTINDRYIEDALIYRLF